VTSAFHPNLRPGFDPFRTFPGSAPQSLATACLTLWVSSYVPSIGVKGAASAPLPMIEAKATYSKII
jgi:hypothetical protein